MVYSRQDAIDSIREARNQLGHSPSRSEYSNLDLSPAPSTIRKRFGGWDSLKEEAGLTLCEGGVEPKYSLNTNYFSSINSPEKAYWLGVLYGDGWYTPSTGVVGLALQEKAHVQRFAEAVGSDHPVEEVGGVFRIRIGRQGFAQDLAKHGFDADKTDSATLPELDTKLRPHFVRGLSDADGTFADNTDCAGFTWMIAGNSGERFEKLADWLPVEPGIYEKSEGSFCLQVADQSEVRTLVDWMYPEGTDTFPSLPRKTALAHY